MGKPSIQSPREQLEHDFGWFNRYANINHYLWRGSRLVAAASALAASGVILLTDQTVLAAGLALLAAVLQVLDATAKPQESWRRYRVTAERLRIETGLFDGKAGVYADSPNPDRLLAERLASIRRRELASFERLWAEQAPDAEPGQ
jgi:hypothetical protein